VPFYAIVTFWTENITMDTSQGHAYLILRTFAATGFEFGRLWISTYSTSSPTETSPPDTTSDSRNDVFLPSSASGQRKAVCTHQQCRFCR